jgi:hypothetical protein
MRKQVHGLGLVLMTVIAALGGASFPVGARFRWLPQNLGCHVRQRSGTHAVHMQRMLHSADMPGICNKVINICD